jgi:Domain of unknown function (DUF5666)
MTMDPIQPGAPVPSPVSVVAVAPRARSSGVLNLLLIGAAILAVGGVAFAIGRSSAPASGFRGVGTVTDAAIVPPGGSFAPGPGGPRGFALDGGPAIDGTVTAVDADSITLMLKNGEEMTIALDGDTAYHEATDATAADVAVGDDVSVKVDGGGRIQSSNGGSSTTDLTAGDVTVAR